MSRAAAFAAGALLYAAGWVAGALWLPDPAPMHFGGSGAVDDWAAKGSYLALTGALGVGLAVLVLLLARGADRVPLRWLNVPHQDWWTATPEREQRLRAMLAGDGALLGGLTLGFVGVVDLLVVRAAQHAEPRLGAAMWVSLAVYLAAMLGACVHAAAVRYRPRDAA